MVESDTLSTVPAEPIRSQALVLSAMDIRRQVNLIQEVMASVMKVGTHYGTVPGCGDKPSLLKPGAEKICMTFRLRDELTVEEFRDDQEIRYRVLCRLVHIPTGQEVGQGVGTCSTAEVKYNWREAVCQEEWDSRLESERRVKYGKGRWDKAKNGYETSKVLQVRTNPADQENTVLKMAKKRALVDAVLTATAASDIFTQDIEDIGEISPPTARSTSQDAPGSTISTPKAPIPNVVNKAEPSKTPEATQDDGPPSDAEIAAQEGTKPSDGDSGLPLSDEEERHWTALCRLAAAVGDEVAFWGPVTTYTQKDGKVRSCPTRIKAEEQIHFYAGKSWDKKFILPWLISAREKFLTDEERKLLAAFSKLGVQSGVIEDYLGHAVYKLDAQEVEDLRAIYGQVKGGMSFGEAANG